MKKKTGGAHGRLEPVVGPDWEAMDDSIDDDEDSEEFDCGRYDQSAPGGMWPAGMCRLAGTEECDFECPYN